MRRLPYLAEGGTMACNRHLVPAAGLLFLAMVLRPCGGLAQGVLEEVPFDQKLVPGAPAADAFGDGFGVELAIAGDTLVVGASTANVGGKFFVGAADLFLRDPASGAWGAPRRLLAADGAAFDQLGGAGVAVAGDEVFLGVPLARGEGGVLQQGAVYVFARDAGGADAWGQAAKLTDASVGSIGHFGASIALEGDLMAVGASRGGGGNGQVTILERGGGGPGDWRRGGLDPRQRGGRRRPAAGKLRRRGGAGGRPALGRRQLGRRELLPRG